MDVVIIATAVLALVLARAWSIIRLRKRIVVPPAHPRSRALDADWNWPR